MRNNEKSNFLHIKNIFESISNEYDFMNDLMTFKNHSKWKEEIVEISIDSSPKKILDIADKEKDQSTEYALMLQFFWKRDTSFIIRRKQ